MKSWMKWLMPLGVALILLSLTTLSHSQPAIGGPSTAPSAVIAIAVISPTGENKTAGWVKFTQVDGGVSIVADVTGLTPGKHGFHIHEWGDLSDTAKGMAVGGHFGPNIPWQPLPGEAAHPAGTMHHSGEMGNLEADASGHAHLEVTLPGLTITGPTNAILGRSIIVHAQPDVGDRIGQAVIGLANPGAGK